MTTLLLLILTAFTGTANAQRDVEDREMTEEVCEDAGGKWAEDRGVCYEKELDERKFSPEVCREKRLGWDESTGECDWPEERDDFDVRECFALREHYAAMSKSDEGFERMEIALDHCWPAKVDMRDEDGDKMRKMCSRFGHDGNKDWSRDDKDRDKDQDRETSAEGRQSDGDDNDHSHDDDRDERESDVQKDWNGKWDNNKEEAKIRHLCRRMIDKSDDKRDLERPDIRRLVDMCKRVNDSDDSSKGITSEEKGLLSEKCLEISDKLSIIVDEKRDQRVQDLRDRIKDQVERIQGVDNGHEKLDRMKDLRNRAEDLRDRMGMLDDDKGPRDYIEDPLDL